MSQNGVIAPARGQEGRAGGPAVQAGPGGEPRAGRAPGRLAALIGRWRGAGAGPGSAASSPAASSPASASDGGTQARAGALAALAVACRRIADGDLDHRIPFLGDDPQLRATRIAVNHVLDVTDAFIREAQASLAAAGENRFHRAFLEQGMPGAFGAAARQINTTRTAMAAAAAQEERSRRAQQQIADTASDAAQIVAAAAVELSASADALGDTTHRAVDEARSASEVVERLRQASEGIERSLAAISQVTSQTKMLALNATIEAVRAGTAGTAFVVVAGEVKSLADQTNLINQRIHDDVERSHEAAQEAIAAITQIAALIQDMDSQVTEVGRAANGGAGIEGLAQMAIRLHTDTSQIAGSTA